MTALPSPPVTPAPAPLRLCVRRRRVADPGGCRVEVSLQVPSDVGCIEEVVDLLVRHCCGDPGLSRRLRFNFRVAVAEALANAIVQGNRQDRGKVVAVHAECAGEAISVRVTDQGEGFEAPEPGDLLEPPDLENPSGRGLFLIRHLVDDVRFNTLGNSICMTLRRR